MKNWYVLFHNPLSRKSLMDLLQGMDVEVLCPYLEGWRKRPDRPSSIRTTVALFPGYLLVYFDPEVIHTTAITALNGAYSFVRFSDQPCILQAEVVEKLKDALVRTDRSLSSIEYRNLPTELEKSLHFIVGIREEASRQAAFFALLKQGAALERLVSQYRALCYTAVNAA